MAGRFKDFDEALAEELEPISFKFKGRTFTVPVDYPATGAILKLQRDGHLDDTEDLRDPSDDEGPYFSIFKLTLSPAIVDELVDLGTSGRALFAIARWVTQVSLTGGSDDDLDDDTDETGGGDDRPLSPSTRSTKPGPRSKPTSQKPTASVSR